MYRRTQDQTRPWWRVTSSSHAAARRSLACDDNRDDAEQRPVIESG